MKKKIIYIIGLLVIMLSLTGCVKYEAEMTIKKDKSMDFSVTYAITKALGEKEDLVNETAKKELEQKGFIVTDYDDENMTGFKITKKYGNIDDYSSETDVSFDLSDLEKYIDSKIFKVEKGFLKNKYTADFKFDTDTDLGMDDEEDDYETEFNNLAKSNYQVQMLDEEYEDDDYYYEDDIWEDENETNESDSMDDFFGSEFKSLATNSMSLNFKVNLPVAALSSNASSNIDNKVLSWDMTKSDFKGINFSFELYNMNNIYIIAGAATAIIVLLIVIISISKKGKKAPVEEAKSVIEGNAPLTPTSFDNPALPPQEEIPAEPIDEATPVEPPVVEEPTPITPAESVEITPETPLTEQAAPAVEPAVEMPEVPTQEEVPTVEPVLEPEAPVVEPPVIEEPTPVETPIVETPVDITPEAPIVETPAVEPALEPAIEMPEAPVVEPPVVETPADITPEAPVVETPAVEPALEPAIEMPEAPVVESPVVEEPTPAETPIVEAPVVETPAVAPALEPAIEMPEAPVVETPAVEPIVENKEN